MGKRANGEHSIYQRKDGTWCAAIVCDDPATGRRTRKVLYGKTRTQVRGKLKVADERAEAGAPVRDAKATVAAWLAQWRATTLKASNRKATTKELYEILCKHHLEAEPFGAIPLDRLRPSEIDRLILALNDKGLSDATVQRIFTVPRVALEGAVRDGLIARNPAASVKQPSVARKEARYLSPTEVARVLRAAKDSRYHCLLALIAATGLRRGGGAPVEGPGSRGRDTAGVWDALAHRRQARGHRAQDREVPPHAPAVPIGSHDARSAPQAASGRADAGRQHVGRDGSRLHDGERDLGRAAQHPSRRHGGGARRGLGRRRGPHPSPFGCDHVARERRPSEGRVRAPRTREHRDHSRHLRTCLGRDGTRCHGDAV